MKKVKVILKVKDIKNLESSLDYIKKVCKENNQIPIFEKIIIGF